MGCSEEVGESGRDLSDGVETNLRGLEYSERNGAVREVSEPENERKERTVEAGREGSPDTKPWPVTPTG